MNTRTKSNLKRTLSVLLTMLMLLSCFSAGLSVFAEHSGGMSGIPTRDDMDWYTNPNNATYVAPLYGAETWDGSGTQSFRFENFDGNASNYYNVVYPGNIYLSVGESLEAAGYNVHLTGHFGNGTGYRLLLNSLVWGETSRSGYNGIFNLIPNYSHQGTMSDGSTVYPINQVSNTEFDFSNNANSAGNIPNSGEGFESGNETMLVWRLPRSDSNYTYDEYVFLTGQAENAGTYTFSTSGINPSLGAAQGWATFAWNTSKNMRKDDVNYSSVVIGGYKELQLNVTVYDKSTLNLLVNAAEEDVIDVDASDLAAAKAVLTNREVTQTEIDAAVESLGGEIAALVALNAPLYDGAGDLTNVLTKTSDANKFTAVAYHCQDPATGTKNWTNRDDVPDYDELVYGVYGDAYRNLVYAPFDQTEWIEKEWHNCYMTFATPRNVVMVYDGVSGHEPMSPIMMQLKGNGSNGPRALDYLAVDENVPSLKFCRQWAGYMDESDDGYKQWPDERSGRNNITFDKNSYINFEYRDRNSMHRLQTENQSNKNTRRDYGNAFVYVGSGNENTFLETFSETNLHYSHTWYAWPSNSVDDEKIPSKGNIYVLNYKQIYNALDSAKACYDELTANGWKYTEESVARAKATLYQISLANPKNSIYDYSADPGAAAAACAANIKKAFTLLGNIDGNDFSYEGLNLVVDTGTVYWVNDDGTPLKTDSNLLFGTTPLYNGQTPQKPSDERYSYTFEGNWTPAVDVVNAHETTYTAAYTATPRSYNVTLSGTYLSTTTYQNAATYNPDDTSATYYYTSPVPGTTNNLHNVTGVTGVTVGGNDYSGYTVNADYTVTIPGEDILGDIVISYTTEPKAFTLTVVDSNNHMKDVTYPDVSYSPVANEMSSTTLQPADHYAISLTSVEVNGSALGSANYSFNPSTNVLSLNRNAVVGNVTVNVATSLKNYQVTFAGGLLNNVAAAQFGTPFSATLELAPNYYINSVAVTAGGAALTEDTDYTFDPDTLAITINGSAITGDILITATTVKKYTITWLDDNGGLIDETLVEDGVVPTHADASKENTAQYSYAFSGWTPTPVAATAPATYTAQFNQTVNKYRVTFLDEDGETVLKVDEADENDYREYDYGTPGASVVQPNTPTKAPNAQYSYSFNAWTPPITLVTGNATYTATYTETPRTYNVTVGGANITSVNDTATYGTAYSVTITAGSGYHVHGLQSVTVGGQALDANEYEYTNGVLTIPGSAILGDIDVVAVANQNSYTITWVLHGGTETTPAEENEIPTYDAPSYTENGHVYVFDAWDTAPVPATGNAVYTASYVIDPDNENNTHNYGEASYAVTEADDVISKVTATKTCDFCGFILTEEAVENSGLTSEVTTPATCTAPGVTTYTATFSNFASKDYTRSNVPVDANAHTYNNADAAFGWVEADGTWKYAATIPCADNAGHDAKVVYANVTSSTATATCVDANDTTYVATGFPAESGLELPGDYADKVVPGAVDANAHTYNNADAVFGWVEADGTWKYAATIPCANDAGHEAKVVYANVTSETANATCTIPGDITYTATGLPAESGLELPGDYANKVVSGAVDPNAHTYNNADAVFGWVEADGTWKYAATIPCAGNAAHEAKVVYANVTSETANANCTVPGDTTYTATGFPAESGLELPGDYANKVVAGETNGVHEWNYDAPIVTAPTKDGDVWTDGSVAYPCIHNTEHTSDAVAVARADYSAYDDVVAEAQSYIDNNDLNSIVRGALQAVIDTALAQDLVTMKNGVNYDGHTAFDQQQLVNTTAAQMRGTLDNILAQYATPDGEGGYTFNDDALQTYTAAFTDNLGNSFSLSQPSGTSCSLAKADYILHSSSAADFGSFDFDAQTYIFANSDAVVTVKYVLDVEALLAAADTILENEDDYENGYIAELRTARNALVLVKDDPAQIADAATCKTELQAKVNDANNHAIAETYTVTFLYGKNGDVPMLLNDLHAGDPVEAPAAEVTTYISAGFPYPVAYWVDDNDNKYTSSFPVVSGNTTYHAVYTLYDLYEDLRSIRSAKAMETVTDTASIEAINHVLSQIDALFAENGVVVSEYTTVQQNAVNKETMSGQSFINTLAGLISQLQAVSNSAPSICTGHEYNYVDQRMPSCTEPGYTSYKVCRLCNTKVGGEEIPATGHSETYERDLIRSGALTDGTCSWDTYTCKNGCGDYYLIPTYIVRYTDDSIVPGATVTLFVNGQNISVLADNGGRANFRGHIPPWQLVEGEYDMTVTKGETAKTGTMIVHNGRVSINIMRLDRNSMGIPVEEDPGSNDSASFRCPMCNAYDELRSMPVVGWFVAIVHFFVHMAYRIINSSTAFSGKFFF